LIKINLEIFKKTQLNVMKIRFMKINTRKILSKWIFAKINAREYARKYITKINTLENF